MRYFYFLLLLVTYQSLQNIVRYYILTITLGCSAVHSNEWQETYIMLLKHNKGNVLQVPLNNTQIRVGRGKYRLISIKNLVAFERTLYL